MLLHSQIHTPLLGQHLHLQHPRLQRPAEIVDRFEQSVRLPDLLLRLLQSPLGDVDAVVAVADVFGNVAFVVEVEAQLVFAGVGQGLVFLAQVGLVGFGAGAEVLLGVGEEVVGAGAAEVGAADFGVGDGERGLFGGAGQGEELVAHELFEEFALFCRHDGGRGGRRPAVVGGWWCELMCASQYESGVWCHVVWLRVGVGVAWYVAGLFHTAELLKLNISWHSRTTPQPPPIHCLYVSIPPPLVHNPCCG